MKRLNYIDGLKGWCAVSVCILHFLLMFVIGGFIGWKCLPEAALNPFEYYFEWFPYSILTNNSFPLYIFFALTSFIVSYTFLKNKNDDKLNKISGDTLIQDVPSWHHQAVENVDGTALAVTGTVNVNGVKMIEIVERTDKDFAVGLQYHPEAVIDKTIDCQTNASDYMSYEDALEVFTYLIDLVS